MNWFYNPFLKLFIIGGSLSCIVRALFDNAIIGATWATVICLFCLLWYFLHAARRDTAWQHTPDNVYYLGFLFTLLSLVYSLVTLFILNSDEIDGAGQTYILIGSFGIALVSTIFGILFRILLLQLPSRSTYEVGQQGQSEHQDFTDATFKFPAHQGLADAAFKLRSELTQTIADINVFHQTVIQALNETVQESNKARMTIIQQIEDAGREQAKMLSMLSDTVIGKLNASVEHIQESLDKSVNQQLQKAQRSVELMTQGTETLDRSIQNSLTKIAGGGEKIEATFGSVPESLQGIVNGLQSTTQNIETLVAQCVPLHSNIQKTMTLIGEAMREIERTTVTLTDITEKFCQTIQQEVGQWQSMTQEVRSSLIQATEKFTRVVRNS